MYFTNLFKKANKEHKYDLSKKRYIRELKSCIVVKNSEKG